MDWFRKKRKTKKLQQWKLNLPKLAKFHPDKPQGIETQWKNFVEKMVEEKIKQLPKGVVKSAFRDSSVYQQKLEQRGFKRLGSGYHSSVYAHPKSDKVIKVVNQLTDPWIDYAVWANRQGHGGKLAPKVYSYKLHQKGQFSVSVMEKLDKTVIDLGGEHDLAFTHDLFQHYLQGNNLQAGIFLDQIVPDATKFADALKKRYDGTKVRFDLHSQNFMVRKDGSFVVIDPLAGKGGMFNYGTSPVPVETSTYKRLRAKDFAPSPELKSYWRNYYGKSLDC